MANKSIKIKVEHDEDMDLQGVPELFSEDNSRLQNALESVFANDMLREKILEYVLFPFPKCKPHRARLGTIRLVQKPWLRTCTDLMRKDREFLFHATLNRENSVDGTPYVTEKGKLLQNLIDSLGNPVGETVPTFSLRLLPDFFRRENYENLSDCLLLYGGALTDLDLAFPLNSSMTLVFPTFTLPRLVGLSVQFTDQRLTDSTVATQLQNNSHSVYPLQTILNATSELTELQFKFTTNENLIPFGFDFLKLPDTITELFFDCPIKTQDLELLLRNDLPNLRHLRLFGTNSPFAEGLIYRILSKFRGTLKTLNLRGSHYYGRIRNTTLFKLPVMEKLETFTITSQTWELEEDPDHLVNWNLCLPALNEIRMLHQPENLFRKWTENSRYESVSKLFISLINTTHSGLPPMGEQPLPINLERMQCLHMAFPNVVMLELSMCGSMTCGIKYIFMEMRNMQKLAITVKGSPQQHLPAMHWDALLIGAPTDLVNSIRRNPEFWNSIELKHEHFPSIRKLTELKSLALVETEWGSTAIEGSSHGPPLISDLAFHFGFLKMEKLQHLLLSGRFKASSAMTERWKREKGTSIHSMKRYGASV